MFTRPLSYAKAADLMPILTRSALSSRGEVQVDTRTNTLIIRDLPDRLTAAAELVAALDMPQPQVEIEARIVQTTRDFARASASSGASTAGSIRRSATPRRSRSRTPAASPAAPAASRARTSRPPA